MTDSPPSLANLFSVESSGLTGVLQYILDRLGKNDSKNNQLELLFQQITNKDQQPPAATSDKDNDADIRDLRALISSQGAALSQALERISELEKQKNSPAAAQEKKEDSFDPRLFESRLSSLEEFSRSQAAGLSALTASVESAGRDLKAVKENLDKENKQRLESEQSVTEKLISLDNRISALEKNSSVAGRLKESGEKKEKLENKTREENINNQKDYSPSPLLSSDEASRLSACEFGLKNLSAAFDDLSEALKNDRETRENAEKLRAAREAENSKRLDEEARRAQSLALQASEIVRPSNSPSSAAASSVDSSDFEAFRALLAALQAQLAALNAWRSSNSAAFDALQEEFSVGKRDALEEKQRIHRRLEALEGKVEGFQNGWANKAEKKSVDLAIDEAAQQREALRRQLGDVQNRLDQLVKGVREGKPGGSVAAAAVLSSGPSDSFDSSSLRSWVEGELNAMWARDKSLRSEIQELHAKWQSQQGNWGEFGRFQQATRENLDEIFRELKRLDNESRENLAASDRQWRILLDGRLEDLWSRLRESEKTGEKNLQKELKRFEKDFLIYLAANRSVENEAAVGKIHFRCISCDQATNSLSGPSSMLFQRATAPSTSSLVPALPLVSGGLLTAGATTMAIDRGKEIFLPGRDGQLYKGRTDTNVILTTGDPNRNSQFQVSYIDRQGGAPNTPSIASNPSVALAPSFAATAAALPPTSARLPHRPNTAPFHEISHSQTARTSRRGSKKAPAALMAAWDEEKSLKAE